MSIFYNSAGEFQWVSITAGISLFGILTTLLSTFYINKKSRRANVKATTKIEWLNKIIELSAEFINDYQLIGIDVRNILVYKIQKNSNTFINKEDIVLYDPVEIQKQKINLNQRHQYDKKINNFAQEFNDKMKRINYVASQLSLYFMERSESKKPREMIEELRRQLLVITEFINTEFEEKLDKAQYVQIGDNLNVHLDKLDILTENFQESMSRYLSSELKKIERKI